MANTATTNATFRRTVVNTLKRAHFSRSFAVCLFSFFRKACLTVWRMNSCSCKMSGCSSPVYDRNYVDRAENSNICFCGGNCGRWNGPYWRYSLMRCLITSTLTAAIVHFIPTPFGSHQFTEPHWQFLCLMLQEFLRLLSIVYLQKSEYWICERSNANNWVGNLQRSTAIIRTGIEKLHSIGSWKQNPINEWLETDRKDVMGGLYGFPSRILRSRETNGIVSWLFYARDGITNRPCKYLVPPKPKSPYIRLVYI